MKRLVFPVTVERRVLVVASGQAEFSTRLSRSRIACLLFCLWLLPVVCPSSVQALSDDSVDGVTVKDEKAYAMRGDQLDALKDVLKLPFEVEVNTNGAFTVAKGKERQLKAGQVIRRDGWLLNPDGSIQPVFDHVAMLGARVMVVRDGRAETLTDSMTFPNGLRISPDGSCALASGGISRLADGQLFRLDGSPVLSKDTVTMKGGVVVVQKSGKPISLQPIQMMGMNDGTQVHGDGTINYRDGTLTQLSEGQVIFIDGPAARH